MALIYSGDIEAEIEYRPTKSIPSRFLTFVVGLDVNTRLKPASLTASPIFESRNPFGSDAQNAYKLIIFKNSKGSR